MPTTTRYRIEVMDSERGWGKNYWYEYFDTRDQAQSRIKEINSANTSSTAPDYYMQAYNDIVETSSHMKEI